ncbi:MAG: hypothetical protein JW769_03295 [Parachlamydiales bacterium]|nr:hypothetical protein [Parachlamydiales bacterium]
MPITESSSSFINIGHHIMDAISTKNDMIENDIHNHTNKIEQLIERQQKLDQLKSKIMSLEFNQKQCELAEDVIQLAKELQEAGISLGPLEEDITHLREQDIPQLQLAIERARDLASLGVERQYTEVKHLFNDRTQMIDIGHFIIRLLNDLIHKINERTGR